MSAESPENTQYIACMLLMWGQIDYIVGGSDGLMTHNDIGSECPSAMTSRILYMTYFVYNKRFHQDYSVEESLIHFRFIFKWGHFLIFLYFSLNPHLRYSIFWWHHS